MLLILNCRAICGTDIPQLAPAIKRAGHKIVILGGPGDLERGDIMRAEHATQADMRTVAEREFSDSRKWAITEVLEGLGDVGALVVSEDARDLAAADLLEIPTISPFDFDISQLGESA